MLISTLYKKRKMLVNNTPFQLNKMSILYIKKGSEKISEPFTLFK